jgi:hypothetical protein
MSGDLCDRHHPCHDVQEMSVDPFGAEAVIAALDETLRAQLAEGATFTAEAFAADDWRDTLDGIRRRYVRWSRATVAVSAELVRLKTGGFDVASLEPLRVKAVEMVASVQRTYATEVERRRTSSATKRTP